MNKMDIYNQAKSVPKDAKKTIMGGKLKGFSNINPMYRIKRLTEIFGPVGDGWWYEITNRELTPISTGEVFCFVDINLYYKTESGEISRPIPGTGGSSFISNTKTGLQASDECYKMALTDAISVAAKALGVGADVYWAEDLSTKYDQFAEEVTYYAPPVQPQQAYAPVQGQPVYEQPQYTPQPTVQQPVYEQPAQYTAAPPVQPQQPTAPQAGFVPPTPEQAAALVCQTGFNKGKTLGEILGGNRGRESLDFIIARSEDLLEREAAKVLLKASLG